MLIPPPAPRAHTDAWIIREAGLPVRVVNAVEKAGLNRVKELREASENWLGSLRNMGKTSLEHIRLFFADLQQLEEGRLAFSSLREILERFLNEEELFVIYSRYGLLYPHADIGQTHMTLQQIGNQRDLTRERVRQLEENALTRLKLNLARQCLEPATAWFLHSAEQHGGALSRQQLMGSLDDPFFGGLNPAACALLISTLWPDRLCYFNGFFSRWTAEYLEQTAEILRAELQRASRPLPVDSLVSRVEQHHERPAAANELLVLLLEHDEQVISTSRGTFLASSEALECMLRDILQKEHKPLHYRAVTEAFNQRVLPPCRKGSGFILDQLNQAPSIEKQASGIYGVREMES